MSFIITIRVAGVPVPKGSTKAFYIKALNRCVTMANNANKQKPWVSSISLEAEKQMAGRPPARTMVHVNHMVFYFPRPKGHYGTGKNANTLKDWAPEYHTTTPDIDKLERCVYDAMTNIVYSDDAIVCDVKSKRKLYSEGFVGMELEMEVFE